MNLIVAIGVGLFYIACVVLGVTGIFWLASNAPGTAICMLLALVIYCFGIIFTEDVNWLYNGFVRMVRS